MGITAKEIVLYRCTCDLCRSHFEEDGENLHFRNEDYLKNALEKAGWREIEDEFEEWEWHCKNCRLRVI